MEEDLSRGGLAPSVHMPILPATLPIVLDMETEEQLIW